MPIPLRAAGVLCLVLLAGDHWLAPARAGDTGDAPGGRARPESATRASVPGTRIAASAGFVPNRGQWDAAIRYVARFPGVEAAILQTGWVLDLQAAKANCIVTPPDSDRSPPRWQRCRVGFNIAGASASSVLRPGAQQDARHHFLHGADPDAWQTDVPAHADVLHAGVHPGVDVRFRDGGGFLEYDLLLAADADLASVRIDVAGATGLRLVGTDLLLDTPLGVLRQGPPHTEAVADQGSRRCVECCYVLLGATSFGFAAPERRGDEALVIDPGLVWSTYIGGSSFDFVTGMAMDAAGAVIVTGIVTSVDFADPDADRLALPGFDVFVARLRGDGRSLEWSVRLSGIADDHPLQVQVDASGHAIVTGRTRSGDFPTTPGAFQRVHRGQEDVFVARLDPSGLPVWSTLLGGAGSDEAYDLRVGLTGSVTVVGSTNSPGFPTTPGAFDRTLNFNGDAFATRLAADGSRLEWSTFLGGSWGDAARAVALTASGDAVVGGRTGSPEFPTTVGAFDTTYNGRDDAFLVRLDATGSQLVWSTFLGGTLDEGVTSLHVDSTGVVTAGGGAVSRDFPVTPGAWQTIGNTGGTGGFVTRLAAAGDSLLWSTYHDSYVARLDIFPSGAVAMVGQGSVHTTPGAFARMGVGGWLVVLDPRGRQLWWGSVLAGRSSLDAASAVVVRPPDLVIVGGGVESPDFPTTPGAHDRTLGGTRDGFAMRLRVSHVGVRRFGAPTLHCAGAPTVHVLDDALAGAVGFGFACTAAPRAQAGVLLLGTSLAAPVPVLGVDLWLDPTQFAAVLPAAASTFGEATTPLSLAGVPPGTRLAAQYVFHAPTCTPSAFTASDAVDVTVQ